MVWLFNCVKVEYPDVEEARFESFWDLKDVEVSSDDVSCSADADQKANLASRHVVCAWRFIESAGSEPVYLWSRACIIETPARRPRII